MDTLASLGVIRNNQSDYLQWRQGSGSTIEVYDIAVFGDRRKGSGRKMIQDLYDIVAKQYSSTTLIWAIARESNRIARDFYLGIGWRIIAVLPQFYKEGNAIMFGRNMTWESGV